MPPHLPWTRQADDELTAHWRAGLSTTAIGAAMGRSKNAIIGRAHRLNLPARESPIKRRAPDNPKTSKPAPKLAPPSIIPQARGSAYVAPRDVGCRWISNDDLRNPAWCDRERVAMRAYCAEHLARCYQPPKPPTKKAFEL